MHLKRKKNELCMPYHARIREFSSGMCVCGGGGGGCSRSICYKKALATFFFFNLIILVLNWYYLIIEVQWLISKKKYYHFPRFQSGTNISRGSNFFRGRSNYRNPYSLWFSRDSAFPPPPPPPPGSVHAHIGFRDCHFEFLTWPPRFARPCG